MLHIGQELGSQMAVDRAAARLHEARRLDHDIAQVDAALRQAEDSVRLNPRVKEGLLYRVVLRTGLDTLEICTVILRVMSRTLTDLAKARTEEPLFPPEVAEALKDLSSISPPPSRASPSWSPRRSAPTPKKPNPASPASS